MTDDEVIRIYTAPNAPPCPKCGARLVLVRYSAGDRTWPALCCRTCPYWRPASSQTYKRVKRGQR